MLFSLEERPESRQSTLNPPSHVRVYKAAGDADDGAVRAAAISGTPATIFSATLGTLYRQDIRIDPDGFAQYVVTVPYGQRKRETGSYTFTFDTTGATVNIKAGKEHIASYPASGETATDHQGAIGVTKDGSVEGADIVIPALRLTCTFRHPEAVVTIPFVKTLANATGATNLNPFLTFAAGELLFLGATGSDGSEAEAEVAYNFLASNNATGLTVGDITSIAKAGHDLLWIEFRDAEDSGRAATQPRCVYIERVYDPIDFASVFGWS